jgi:hypothetical protein
MTVIDFLYIVQRLDESRPFCNPTTARVSLPDRYLQDNRFDLGMLRMDFFFASPRRAPAGTDVRTVGFHVRQTAEVRGRSLESWKKHST